MSEQKPIIAILGLPGSGRGMVIKRLVEVFGFTQLDFMAPVERMVGAGFNIGDEEFKSSARRINRPEFGNNNIDKMVKTLAQDWGRKSINSDIWAELWKAEAMKINTPIVVGDAAYPNEIAKIKEVGGEIWRIERNRARVITTADKMRLQLKCDITIQNEGHNPERLYQVINLALLGLEQKLKSGAF